MGGLRPFQAPSVDISVSQGLRQVQVRRRSGRSCPESLRFCFSVSRLSNDRLSLRHSKYGLCERYRRGRHAYSNKNNEYSQDVSIRNREEIDGCNAWNYWHVLFQPREDSYMIEANSFSFLQISASTKSDGESTLFTTQHSDIVRTINELIDLSRKESPDFLAIKRSLTDLYTRLTLHFSLEEGILHAKMASDARLRIRAEQHTRQLMHLRTEMGSFMRRFSAPSIIAKSFESFKREMEDFCQLITEQFQSEERQIYQQLFKEL